MVLTANQPTTFLEDVGHMGIPHRTVVQMQQEGIITVDDIAEFEKETIETLSSNLRRPSGRVQDPNAAAPEGATIPTPPFVFGAKSQTRLVVAAKLLRYYITVGRAVTLSNITFNPTMKNFADQWKALEDKSKAEPEVPKITKALPVIKWTEAMRNFMMRKYGVRTIPLAYVIRNVETPPPIGPIEVGRPHSDEHGSIEDELVARASHTHALYREDNAAVFYQLEEATRSTSYAASIKPFQRTKNGRGAWLALSSQYAGKDKWEAEIKRHEQVLHTREWKGQSNFSLDKFIALHRNAFVSMQAAAEHITYQLPNEHSRVGYLMGAIRSSDAGLQAAMASIKTDQSPEGLRNNFEAAASHLLPYDPVLLKRTAKRDSGDISSTATEQASISAFGTKKGIGKSGVHLRYHNAEEYKALSKEEKAELREWREKKKGSEPGSAAKKKQKASQEKASNEKAIASAVTKQVAEQLKVIEQTKTAEADAEAYIMSLVKKHGIKSTLATVTAETPADDAPPSLKSIIERARVNKKLWEEKAKKA